MNKNATNILGIIIVILAGTYFFVMYCNLCGAEDELFFALLHNAAASELFAEPLLS